MRPDLKKASPRDVPVQRTPEESSKRQFTLLEGSPSPVANVVQCPRDNELRPFGVANQIVPSRVSRIAETVFDARPSAVENVTNLPSLTY